MYELQGQYIKNA